LSRRIGVYPGSFDPLHNGHLDVIRRCRKLFDELWVAVLHNEEKRALFSVSERVEMIRDLMAKEKWCRVDSFSGLLVDFLDRRGASTVVRGLRAVSDFEYELQMALMNRHLNERAETVFLVPKAEYGFLSSRLIKEVCGLGGDLRGLVPSTILRRLESRLRPSAKAPRGTTKKNRTRRKE
jgi:pantetheine-phosphate adenylyltransferase